MNKAQLILPVWNERDNLQSVLAECLNAYDWGEITLVDDGCSDGSSELMDELARKCPVVRCLHLTHGGKDKALWSGFESSRIEWVCMMDADGQYDPNDFNRMFAFANSQNLDAVWGIRTQRQDILFRRAMSRMAKLIRRYTLGRIVVQDAGCGIWLAKRVYLLNIAERCCLPQGQLHCHLAELIAKQKGAVGEVSITHRNRREGLAKYGFINRLIPGYRSLRQVGQLSRDLRGMEWINGSD